MDITLRSSELSKELAFLEKAAPQKAAIPILSNVLIQADPEGGVRLAATNLEVGLITSCQAQVDLPGATTLPVKKLLDMVKLMPNASVRFQAQEGMATVSCGSYKARLQVLPPSDFPKLPSLKSVEMHTLPRVALRDMVVKTRFSVTDKDTRFFMNGALLALSGSAMMMASTDGHRLTRIVCPCGAVQSEPIIVPSTTLDKLADLLSEGVETDVSYGFTERHLFFTCDGRLLVSRRVEGTFPAYERIIPKTHDKSLDLPVAEMSLALRRVGLISENTDVVSMVIEEGLLTLTATEVMIGDAGEQLKTNYTGPKFVTAVNWKYLLEFLEVVSSSSVKLEIKDPADALLLSEGGQYQYVVMPVRV